VPVDGGVAVVDRIPDSVAASQRTPGPVRPPAPDSLAVLPFSPTGITRTVVDLIDRLRPSTIAQTLGYLGPFPRIGTGIGEDPGRLVLPVLPPVLDDHLIALFSDDKQVLQHDLRPRVLDDANRFMTARDFPLERFVSFQPGRRFLHVEANLVIACHGKDGRTVALEMGLFDSFPAILNGTVGP